MTCVVKVNGFHVVLEDGELMMISTFHVSNMRTKKNYNNNMLTILKCFKKNLNTFERIYDALVFMQTAH